MLPKMTSRPNPLKLVVFFLVLSFLAINLNACGKPSFPGDTINEAVTEICKKEYGLDAIPKIYGKTLWLYIPLDYLVDMTGQIDRKTADKIEDAAFSIHRVLLSTDKEIDFYVLVASDIKFIGLDFVIVGYVPDIKRVRLLDISREDYFRRVLNDFEINEDALNDLGGSHVEYVDISLEKFLSEQIVQRIRKKFTEDKSLSKYFTIVSEYWDFADQDFVFDVLLEKAADNIPAKIDPEQIMVKIAAYVIRDYRFKDFKGLKLFNPLGGPDSIYLTKNEVYSFKGGFIKK